MCVPARRHAGAGRRGVRVGCARELSATARYRALGSGSCVLVFVSLGEDKWGVLLSKHLSFCCLVV